jgi:hypothetical protein
MYKLTLTAIFVEATALVLVGFLVGLLYGSWEAVVVTQGAFVACEAIGYAIEGRRRLTIKNSGR